MHPVALHIDDNLSEYKYLTVAALGPEWLAVIVILLCWKIQKENVCSVCGLLKGTWVGTFIKVHQQLLWLKNKKGFSLYFQEFTWK